MKRSLTPIILLIAVAAAGGAWFLLSNRDTHGGHDHDHAGEEGREAALSPDQFNHLWKSGKISGRIKAIEFLGQNPHASVLSRPELIQLASDSLIEARRVALASLKARKDPAVNPLAMTASRDADPVIRIMGIEFLGQKLPPDLLSDSDATVRACAVRIKELTSAPGSSAQDIAKICADFAAREESLSEARTEPLAAADKPAALPPGVFLGFDSPNSPPTTPLRWPEMEVESTGGQKATLTASGAAPRLYVFLDAEAPETSEALDFLEQVAHETPRDTVNLVVYGRSKHIHRNGACVDIHPDYPKIAAEFQNAASSKKLSFPIYIDRLDRRFHSLMVRNSPSFFVVANGNVVRRFSGYRHRAVLAQLLSRPESSH